MGDRILIVGTYDTRDEELTYLAGVIHSQGGTALTMDLSVLGDPSAPTDWSKHDVAQAAGGTIAADAASGDENNAMQIMARGAAALAARLQAEGRFDGVIVLGGSMGTDLALDPCAALPVGVPKYIVSTVSFSPMIPPERLAADVQMILWAGGLYGLNSICKASLSQAAGAVLGAALEARGYEVAVFHATGMGGRAFESLADQGAFAAVLDFAPQEVSNYLFGSAISAGPDRMTAAGRRGIPQMGAPGCYDLVDVVGWHAPPPVFQGQPSHAHNRLISSYLLDGQQRRQVARAICAKLASASAPVTLFLPTQGCNEWDRAGGPLSDPAALAEFCDEMRAVCPANVTLVELDAHINDAAFADAVLAAFEAWVAGGLVPPGTS